MNMNKETVAHQTLCWQLSEWPMKVVANFREVVLLFVFFLVMGVRQV